MPSEKSLSKMFGIGGSRDAIRHAPYHIPDTKPHSVPLFLPFADHTTPPTPSTVTSVLTSPPFTPPSLSSSPTMSTCSSTSATPSREVDAFAKPPSKKRPSSRKTDDDRVRRPANPFILFACDYRNQPHHKGINNRVLSKKAGELWKKMNEAEKRRWRVHASLVKKQHEEDHPDYRYQPRRKKQRESKKEKSPMKLTFPDAPESPSQSSSDIAKLEEFDDLSPHNNALYMSPVARENKLSESISLTELAQRKSSSRVSGGLDASFFTQSKVGGALPAAAASSLLPDLSNMQSFGTPYSSLQWQHCAFPFGEQSQWNAMPDFSLWNGQMSLDQYAPTDASLLDTASVVAMNQALLQSQNQFMLPPFPFGTLAV